MDINLLNDMITQNYIRVNSHPELDLFIYNYTAKAQFDCNWNDITLQCRGLILDGKGNIIARPFPKFFNLGEIENQQIPTSAFDVYEKMDGSLGITYWVNDKVYIATRGSFNSKQSGKANILLNTKYAKIKNQLNPSITYLFEIIYPENRIVVDYGENENLVLLAMIETATGNELSLLDFGFPLVKKINGLNDIHQLKQLEEDNKEGFVIKYKNNFRLKVKFDEYCRIHRIITGVSTISIWKYLKEGDSINELIERVPDEFYDWVKNTKELLEKKFKIIEAIAKADFKTFPTRKETALYFNTCKYPTVLFLMLDERSYDENIWKIIKPDHEKPFVGSSEGNED